MQTVSIPDRLLDQVKAAFGTRNARTAVVKALEKIVENSPPDRVRPELARIILAQRGKKSRAYNNVREALDAALK